MNAFSYSEIESFSDTPTFYPKHADLYNTARYSNVEHNLQHAIYNSDLDNYSDFSEDTPSSLSFDCWEYTKLNELGNRNCFDHRDIRTLEEAWMEYGNMSDLGILTSFDPPQRSRLSDEEMTELFLLEEQQQLQYLAEMVHVEANTEAADYFSKCYSGASPKAYVEPFSQDSVDVFRRRVSMSNKINKEALRVKSNSWILKNQQRKSKEMSPKTQTNVYLLNTAQAPWEFAKSRSTKAPMKVSEAKQVPPETLESIRKDDNLKDKAKEESFPCVSKFNSDDDQKIFLGGLPIGMTERTLREQMSSLGYKVLKRPKILRGFAPEVWMKSAKEAQKLVAKETIMLQGVKVEVRPYNSLTKRSKLRKIPNVGRRSVFLGGLPEGTTARDIKETLMKMGIKVLNWPVITDKFSRQVILEEVWQAAKLIKMRKLLLNGKLVDIRPFVNQFCKE